MTSAVIARRRFRAITLTVAGIATLVFLASVFVFGGYRINTTPSFPLGIWQIATLERPLQVGDTIFICPPAERPEFELARERQYLSTGICDGKFPPLIKTVVALPGQNVSVSGQEVYIDGHRLAHSKIMKRDGQGRPMTAYDGGEVPPDTVFLHSDYVASYDSRYFGPIPTKGILGLAKEIFTFTP